MKYLKYVTVKMEEYVKIFKNKKVSYALTNYAKDTINNSRKLFTP